MNESQYIGYYLECVICFELLNSDSKVLPCQHTYCNGCLQKIVSTTGELRCPECRTKFNIQVDKLPQNVLLNRILEGLKNNPLLILGLNQDKYRCIEPYPSNTDTELELKFGDIVYVHEKKDNGWFKGTLERNGKTGLFPASFVEIF